MINCWLAPSTLCLLEWHVTPLQTNWHIWNWYRNVSRITILCYHCQFANSKYIHDIFKNSRGAMNANSKTMSALHESSLSCTETVSGITETLYNDTIPVKYKVTLTFWRLGPWPWPSDYSETLCCDPDIPAVCCSLVFPLTITKKWSSIYFCHLKTWEKQNSRSDTELGACLRNPMGHKGCHR